ncbi:MAG: hypothetical protein AAF806_14655 [Bacteroidota bacterium]
MKKKVNANIGTGIIMVLAGIANLANGIFTDDGLLFQIAGGLFILGGVVYFYTAYKKNKEEKPE